MVNRRSARVVVAAAVLAISAVLGLWIVVVPEIVMAVGDPAYTETLNSVGRDFAGFQQAGSRVLEGASADLYTYDPAAIAASAGPARFANPPFYALYVVPFALLPFWAGYAVWTGLGLILLLAGVSLLGTHRVATWAVGSLLTFGGLLNVYFGQNTFFTLFLLAAGFLWFKKRQALVGGAALGFATYKAHLLGGFVLWFLGRFRTMWSAVVGALAVVGLLVAVSAALMPGAWAAFAETVAESDSRLADTEVQLSFRQAATLLLPGREFVALAAYVAIVGTVSIGYLWFLRRGDHSVETLFAASVIVSLIVAPRALAYDWILLVIPMVLLFETVHAYRRLWAWCGVSLMWAVLLSVLLTRWQIEHFDRAIQLAPFVLLAVAIVMAWAVLDSEGNPDSSGESEGAPPLGLATP